MKSDGTRDSEWRGIVWWEWSALLPVAMVQAVPLSPWLCDDSVAPITTREHADVLGWMSRECKTSPAPQWTQGSGEMALSHTVGCTSESKPCASPRQHNAAGPDAEGMGELYLRARVWER